MILLGFFNLCELPMLLGALILPFLLGMLFGWGFSRKHKSTINDLERANAKLSSSVSNLEADLESSRKARENSNGEISLLRGQIREKDARLKSMELKHSRAERLATESTSNLESNLKKVTDRNLELEQKLKDLESKSIEVEPEVTKEVTETKTPPVIKKEVDQVKSAISTASSKTVAPALKKLENLKQPKILKKESKASKKTIKPTKAKDSQKKKAVKKAKDKANKVKDKSTEKSATETTIIPKTKSKAGRPKGAKNKSTRQRPKTTRGRSIHDLKKIEGVGPKMEQALRKYGYKTFNKIASESPSVLKEVLMKASIRFKIANTETWPEQASLAAQGKWDELKVLQDSLKGGRK